MTVEALSGPRFVIPYGSDGYPEAFSVLSDPPKAIYGIGNPEALREGLAIVGARKASSYGLTCARRFGKRAGEKGVLVISGGALGCDGEAHRGALEASGQTLVFLGGGCDCLYPARHRGLFQDVVNAGGAVVSEHFWNVSPRPYMVRMRNRLIAALSNATLITEAGLGSGTFSTADEALSANREVLAIPGPITSPLSAGTNRLICQGATPIIDDATFDDALFWLFGALREPLGSGDAYIDVSKEVEGESRGDPVLGEVLRLLRFGPKSLEQLVAGDGDSWKDASVTIPEILQALTSLELQGIVALCPDGRYALT